MSFDRTRQRARRVLLASVVYLPVLYGLLLFDRRRMKFVVLTAVLPFLLVSCYKPTRHLEVFYDVPEFHLTAQDGQPFDSHVLTGKIWVADFIYTTCPGPCPRMTSQMKEVQNAILKMPDVKLVSFTVDPERDTPAVLAAYAKSASALRRSIGIF